MRNEKRKMIFTILLLLILGIGLGYAAILTNLSIDGTTTMVGGSWDIHFENLNVSTGSVSIGTGDSAATITSDTTVAYSITLQKPGDFYDFTVDVKNDGTIDGMIETISSTLNGNPITNLPNALEYTVTYEDGQELGSNQLLSAGEKETYKIHLGFKVDVEPEDLPSANTNYTLQLEVDYIQADENAYRVYHPESFATDDWETITTAVFRGNYPYQVGDEKEIQIDGHTNYLRIINTSYPAECSTPGYSQSSCGFVLEFKKLISGDSRRMNTTDTNAGGWPDTSMRTYLNTTFYNKIPSPLKEAIDDTYVVSSNSCFGSPTNCGVFTSTDKIYILSMCELLTCSSYNHDYNLVRIMDYYQLHTSSSAREKSMEGALNTSSDYWLRTGGADNTSFIKLQEGNTLNDYANYTNPYSPVFRLKQSR